MNLAQKIIIILTMLIVYQANGDEPLHTLNPKDIYLKEMMIHQSLDRIELLMYVNRFDLIPDQIDMIRDLLGEDSQLEIIDAY